MNPIRYAETKRALLLLLVLVAANFLYAAISPTVDTLEATKRSFFQASALLLYVSPWRSGDPKDIYG